MRRALSGLLIAAAVLALVAGLRAFGLLAPLEHAASDLRARVLSRTVDSDIVVVGIDPRSLADLQQWPWPRRYHARLLENLAAAAPKQVFIDIDFSAQSTPEDDAALEAALARFENPQVILPTFFQHTTSADGGLTVSRPLERLARHAQLASVNMVNPGSDSLIRKVRSHWTIGDTTVPSAVALLAGREAMPHLDLPIDFSISAASFGFVSYVDLLAGRVSPEALRDKTVLIGATAVELNDMLPVPVYGSQPGVVVQALALQTLRNGIPTTIPAWMHLTVLAVVACLCTFFFAAHSWRRNLGVLVLGILIVTATWTYAAAVLGIALELIPVVATAAACFAVATVRSLDQQTWRAMVYALGIRRRDALLGSIVESSSDGIICIDAQGRIRTANAAAARLFAAGLQQLPGAALSRFVPTLFGHGSDKPFTQLIGQIVESEAVRPDNGTIPVELSVSRVAIADEMLYTVIVRDISERQMQQRALQYQATHDPLTSLPNRVALASYLAAALERAQAHESVALLMLDLSRFKEVNDTLGHAVGDQVLCEVARRFEAVCAQGFIARIGGDEFTVVLAGVTAPRDVARLSQALSACLHTPITVSDVAIDVGVSIGIAQFPQHADDAATLLKHADVAMYAAKRRRSPFEFYDAAHDQHSVRRLSMVGELRHAITHGQLRLHYQPQVDLRANRVRSVEALVRWQHPQLGAVSPAEFIAIAEATDLIHPLTEWTLQESLQQAHRWRANGFHPRIAVNLSARLLQDVALPRRLQLLLGRLAADPRLLELEITESAMMQDSARALRVTRELRELGVTMSVDDYGTGFSSLGYLRDLPVHALKLDKSFVLGMRDHARDRIIVDSTVQMAHALQLEVVAEGVETSWQSDYLGEAGYDYAQGYLYSPAIPADACLRWVESFNVDSPADAAAERLTARPARRAG